jgi:uncharacterized membrane protein YfcA
MFIFLLYLIVVGMSLMGITTYFELSIDDGEVYVAAFVGAVLWPFTLPVMLGAWLAARIAKRMKG